MPTYELTCAACGNRFERFLTRLLRDEDRVCSSCGSNDVRAGVGGGYGRPPASQDRTCMPSRGFG